MYIFYLFIFLCVRSSPGLAPVAPPAGVHKPARIKGDG
jgi:hypothetical protein